MLMLRLYQAFFALLLLVLASKNSDATLKVLSLSGSHKEMGKDYGRQLKSELHEVLAILKDFYITQHGVSQQALVDQANFFHKRYSYSYESFLEGMAEGAKLTLDNCKILNGMETLGHVLSATFSQPQCAFVYAPPNSTVSGKAIIGRNYDYDAPFDDCSEI